MAKRIFSLLLTLIFILPLFPHSIATGNTYVAINNSLLPITEAMPIKSDGIWYIDYRCFTDSELSVNGSYNPDSQTLALYTWDYTLAFNLMSGTVTNKTTDTSYSQWAFHSNGTIYVPAKFVAKQLGMTYSYMQSVNVLRIKTSNVLQDSMFTYIARDEIPRLIDRKNSSKKQTQQSSPQTIPTEQTEKKEQSSTPSKTEQTSKPSKQENVTKPEPTHKPEAVTKPSTPTKPETTIKPNIPTKPATTTKTETETKPSAPTKPETTTQSEISETPPKAEAPAKPETADQETASDKAEAEDVAEEKKEKTVYLTFDVGTETDCEKILSVLQQTNLKATFFIFGSALPVQDDAIRQISASGHSLGISAFGSTSEFLQSVDSVKSGLAATNELLFQVCYTKSRLVRIPDGSATLSNEQANALGESGYRYWDWDIDVSNMSMQRFQNVISSKGDIVVIRFDAAKASIQNLTAILTYLSENNYTAKPISLLTTPRNLRQDIR